MKDNFVIEYFDVVVVMKQKQRRKKRKERDQNKEANESKKERQEGKEKRTRRRERDRERNIEKGGSPKKLRRNKGRHSKINKKCLFLGGKQGFFVLQSKERKGTKTNKKKQKNNK